MIFTLIFQGEFLISFVCGWVGCLGTWSLDDAWDLRIRKWGEGWYRGVREFYCYSIFILFLDEGFQGKCQIWIACNYVVFYSRAAPRRRSSRSF